MIRSLWSKVGQSPQCGCRACNRAANGVGRRATGTARARKPTFAEVFTACYSSVFATAAVVDSIRKDDRSQDLDRQIQQARRDLDELKKRGSSETNGLLESAPPRSPELSIDQLDILWDAIKHILNTRLSLNDIRYPVTLSECGVTKRLMREYYGCLDESSLRELRKTDFAQLERAVRAESIDPNSRHREPQGPTHYAKLGLSIERIVRRLLWRAKYVDDCERPRGAPSLSPSYDDAWMLLQQRFPRYRRLSPAEGSTETITALNDNLRQLAESSTLSTKEKVGRICYNLLISRRPPDINTYHTLMVAFGKLGDEGLAQTFAHDFYFHSKLRPSPLTYRTLIHHHKNQNRHDDFVEALGCITGTLPRRGAKLRRRHVEDPYCEMRDEHGVHDPRRYTQTGSYMFEQLPLDRGLIEAIMNGFLQFRMLDSAAHFLIECMRAGAAVSSKVVLQVFDECIAGLDWGAAVHLVRGFTGLGRRWMHYMVSSDSTTTAELVDRIHVMLDMCGLVVPGRAPSQALIYNLAICETSLSQFLADVGQLNPVHPESSSLRGLATHLENRTSDKDGRGEMAFGRSEDTKRVGRTEASKSRLLQYESLSKELDLSRRKTNNLVIKLLKRDIPLDVRTSIAECGVAMAVERSSQLLREHVRKDVPAAVPLVETETLPTTSAQEMDAITVPRGPAVRGTIIDEETLVRRDERLARLDEARREWLRQGYFAHKQLQVEGSRRQGGVLYEKGHSARVLTTV